MSLVKFLMTIKEYFWIYAGDGGSSNPLGCPGPTWGLMARPISRPGSLSPRKIRPKPGPGSACRIHSGWAFAVVMPPARKNVATAGITRPVNLSVRMGLTSEKWDGLAPTGGGRENERPRVHGLHARGAFKTEG